MNTTKCHTFIEASAGTGKTYHIMQLLSSWMKEHASDEENILTKSLVLTFTEKAAGELKERLRKTILGLIKENPQLYNRYLLELDQVTISTIHGFCNMVLREYPIESNTGDAWEMGDAPDRLKETLYNLKHTLWKDLNIPSKALEILLIGSNFFSTYEESILEASKLLLTGRDYDLGNEPPAVFSDPSDTLKDQIRETTKSLEKLVGDLKQDKIVNSLLADPRNYWIPAWDSFLNLFQQIDSMEWEHWIVRYFSLCHFPFTSPQTGHKDLVFKKEFIKKASFTEEFATELESSTSRVLRFIFKISEQLLQSVNIDHFIHQTALFLVQKVNERYATSKWMSYDQMLIAVRDAVRNKQELRSALRERFSFCLLDEFQDTDLVQYEIFKTIFLDADDENHFLYLIGDPKQSIYAFRGADLGSYLVAKESFKNFKNETLAINRRSVSGLIQGYNRIFGINNPNSQFFPISEIGIENSAIEYKEVLPPPIDEQTYSLHPGFDEGPIHIVRLTDDNDDPVATPKLNKANSMDKWSLFIAAEIQKLIKDQFTYEISNVPTQLRFNDIAILVRSRADGLVVESALRNFNIPSTFYKQAGIYQSREADQILNIFECLSDPNHPASYRKLLFGDLFQIRVEDLKFFDEHSIDSYEKRMLDEWRKLIAKGSYAEFFRRLEEDSRIFYSLDAKDLKWERRRTNYRQILQKLLEYQIKNHCGLEELSAELTRWKTEKSKEEELPLYDKETEDDAVQILTIHASKGLEWPVVFLVHFADEIKNPTNYDYPKATENGRKWGLSLWEKNKENHSISFQNEQKRLLYVAITRPKIRLYLPYVQLSSKTSPYHQNIYISLNSILTNSNGEPPKEEFTIRNLNFPIEQKKESAHLSKVGTNQSQQTYQRLVHHPINVKRRLYLHSYSSLKKGEIKEISKPEENQIEIIIDPLPIDSSKEESQALPSSANTGLFLHSMFQDIDFRFFTTERLAELSQNSEWNNILKENMDQHGLSKNRNEIQNIAEQTQILMTQTLRAKLPLENGKSFSLCELHEEQTSKEMDFHLLFEKINISGSLGNFLKGSIDLVFEWEGKFYIADYKSDRLPEYSDGFLIQRMEDNSYVLQKNIYAYIFFEYLKSIYGEEDALTKFGGVYYLFVRGMKENTSDGIYYDFGKGNEGAWNAKRFETIRSLVDKQVLSAIKGAVI